MNKSPSFRFYVDNFIEGTCDLDCSEVGAYMRLLCYQWSKGSIPKDKARCERVAGGDVSPHVMAKFPVREDGERRNRRLEIERQKQEEYRQKQAANGRASAEARFNHRSTTVQPPFNQAGNQTPTTVQPARGAQPSVSVSVSVSPSATDAATKLNRFVAYKGVDKATKTDKALEKLSQAEREIAGRFEAALNSGWVNDAGKWVNRIKTHEGKAARVIAEVESAIKEGRIKSTPAQYAEQIWKEFK